MTDYESSELLQKNFNKSHAQLVMDKDDQLFLHKRHINQITKDECVVPTLNDVRAAMAAGMVLRVGPPGCDLSGVAIATPLPLSQQHQTRLALAPTITMVLSIITPPQLR
ncbi:hypothetical protein PGTUg99_001330 [Puccinia graminis f. sp. tritici]|uniref:Uncharacterized protein n=1 Tax=Puccinia graminis f. sp. tritici TaxID=56615 RepID=A0A5B0QX36_PUCGR|nr:hypothetical protein PGTUg99_001330 [Puccinia graminis f. sp. tritici]